MQCHAKEFCKKYPQGCSPHCIGYLQLRTIYKLSNIPLRYQYNLTLKCPQDDLDAFKTLKNIQTNVLDFVRGGRNLLIYSANQGNGKTTWAVKIMAEYFRHVALTNNMRCRGLFVNVPKFLEDLRESMNNDGHEVDIVTDNIQTADLVIWDDIGAEKPSEWVRERLYTLINHRYSNGLSSIYTSNLPLSELQKDSRMGGRIADRIRESVVVQLKGPSRRGEF